METIKNTLDLGLVHIPGYKLRKRVFVTLTLKEGDKFSISGHVQTNSGAWVQGGQIQDTVRRMDSKLARVLTRLWDAHHLNDLTPGTPEQMEALKDMRPYKYPESWYDVACEHLKAKGLYEVELDGQPYKFGHKWLKREIPADDLALIKSIILGGGI